MLLLANGETQAFCAGEVVRFAENDIHGLENTGGVSFEYLAITSPPINFDYAYATKGAKPPVNANAPTDLRASGRCADQAARSM